MMQLFNSLHMPFKKLFLLTLERGFPQEHIIRPAIR